MRFSYLLSGFMVWAGAAGLVGTAMGASLHESPFVPDRSGTYPSQSRLLFDKAVFDELLSAANHDEQQVGGANAVERKWQSSGQSGSLSLPLPDGSKVVLAIQETSVMAPALVEKFPDIKTYTLYSPEHPSVQGRMSLSSQGVFVTWQTPTGEQVSIEPEPANPANLSSAGGYYRSLFIDKSASSKLNPHLCQLSNSLSSPEYRARAEDTFAARVLMDNSVITYRIAVTATRSYVDAQGGTKAGAMAAIARTLNRVNQVYERDAGIRLELIANNDRLIAPEGVEFSGSLDEILLQNQTLVDRLIGSENYDIGHVFTAKGGGLAYVGSACRTNHKAMGLSGNLGVGNDRYAIEFVAHEIGHQLGATHTFNSNQGLCSEPNRNALTAFEPGSGSTIMSYFGICGSDNLQSRADAMFHIGSIRQIQAHKRQFQSSCGVSRAVTSPALRVDAGPDYVIPAHTPFELKGSVSGNRGASLLFGWQQQDAGSASRIDEDTGDNALFRSYLPGVSLQRSFPRQQVLLGLESAKGETLPGTQRSMKFSFVAYDAVGTVRSDSTQLQVIASDASFRLHTPPLYYSRGQAVPVTWDVADTHLPPVACSSVTIHLSTDNGLNFDQLLAENIPNSGKTRIRLPDTVTGKRNARFKLSCSDNVFFSVSPRAFGVATVGTEIPPSNSQPDSAVSSSGTAAGQKTAGAAGSVSIATCLLLLMILLLRVERKKLGSYRRTEQMC